MNRFIVAIILCFGINAVMAQDGIGYGFKAGLNFSTFQGDKEQDTDGNELEEYKFETGFHIGGQVNFKFTDNFGLRTEFLFSQKGSRYNYNGHSYQRFIDVDGDEIFTTGMRAYSVNITNSYIDIPIMGYAKALDWLEFSAGVNVGFLVASSGAGELRYNGVTPNGDVIEEFVSSLDYNFYQDEGGMAIPGDVVRTEIDGRAVDLPQFFGAYYDYPAGDVDNLYNVMDLGVNFGISLFLNQGLAIGCRLNYGLIDITNNDVDRSFLQLEDNELVFRDDIDRTLSLHTFIGFSF